MEPSRALILWLESQAWQRGLVLADDEEAVIAAVV
jgi:hypothetical protein